MAFSNGYTIGFAVVICVVCSTALAGVSLGLKDKQEANARRDLCKNILLAVDLPTPVYKTSAGASCDPAKNESDCYKERPALYGPAVDAMWDEKIELKAIDATGADVDAKTADVDGNGIFDHEDLKAALAAVKNTDKAPAVLGLFVRKDNGVVAIPMNGKGLWGPISGYVAFDPKMTTVTGTTFFAPKETPGLGAEIQAEKWESAWLGKSIVENGKTTPIRVKKDAECQEKTDDHCVDGVAGATITSRGVDQMVAKSLEMYEPYLQRVRSRQ